MPRRCPRLLLCLLHLCAAFPAPGSLVHRGRTPPSCSRRGRDRRRRRDDDGSALRLRATPGRREHCPGCGRPRPSCLCDVLPPERIRLRTRVLVLQHPAEFRRKTISTTPLLRLVLEDVRVLVGRSFDGDDDGDGDGLGGELDGARDEGRAALLLFPGPGAIVLDEEGAADRLMAEGVVARSNGGDAAVAGENAKRPPARGHLLILVDGTWTQAKRMLRNSPALLERCQTVQFAGTSEPSIYDSIRKQPDPRCLSTLESCERTLQLLEPDNPMMKEASRHLLGCLKSMILTQMKYERMHLEKRPDLVRNVAKLREKGERQRRLMAGSIERRDRGGGARGRDALHRNATLPEGYAIRPLVESDAAYVDSRWPFRSGKSLVMIERQILADGLNTTKYGSSTCLGIAFEDGLVACVIRHRNGSLGILHVDEDHRRMGLGEALLDAATGALLARNESPFAFIVDGNGASEALFAKAGWAKADPSGRRGTG